LDRFGQGRRDRLLPRAQGFIARCEKIDSPLVAATAVQRDGARIVPRLVRLPC
jgi:hypothetical protein